MSKLSQHMSPLSEFCDLPAFGQLEFKIMTAVWQREESGESTITAQSCVDNIRTRGKPPAYTTITTVMYRMREKGWLTRIKQVGKIGHYRSTRSRQEVGQELLKWVVADFYDNDPAKCVMADEGSDAEGKLAVVEELTII